MSWRSLVVSYIGSAHLQVPFLTFALVVFDVAFPESAGMKEINSLSHPDCGI